MVYHTISKLYPRKLRENYHELLRYSNIRAHPDRFVGFVALVGLGLSLALSFYLGRFLDFPFWLLWIALFFAIETTVYFWILFQVTKKAKNVEKVLPDALQLMSSNLRAGLTVDKAVLMAARPEFGLLQEELDNVGRQVTVGKELEAALTEMTTRIKSEKLEKTVTLIVAGLRSGGELASLLEQTGRNLRMQDILDQKVKSSVMSYVIFIFFAVAAGAPVLFGLSSFLIEVIKKIFAQINIPASAAVNIPIKISQITIQPEFIVTYTITTLIGSSIMSSLVIGAIAKGKGKEGIKYIPIMILITLGVFFLSRGVIQSALGSLFEF